MDGNWDVVVNGGGAAGPAHGHAGHGHVGHGRAGHGHAGHGERDEEPTAFWEARYADRPRIWSGRPNDALVAVIGGMEPGRALDLGCGEGGDAVWLARHGWHVTGVDISATAVARARQEADRLGEAGRRVELVVADLADWHPDQEYDLVSACFLQSPLTFPRTELLRRAAGAVAPGGRLLVVSHAAPPPWAGADHEHEHLFSRPEDEIATIGVTDDVWEVEIAEIRTRQATGPDGQPGVLDDTVVLLRRR